MEREIVIMRDGNLILAMVGSNIQEGLAGFGESPADALRELANEIELHGYNFVNL